MKSKFEMTKFFLFWKLFGNWKLVIGNSAEGGWGCLASTDCYLKNMQVDHCSDVKKISAKDISANFISKVKESFAQAFAPSFASVLA